MFPPSGISSIYSGNVCGYQFRVAGQEVVDLGAYLVVAYWNTNGGAYTELERFEWRPGPHDRVLEVTLPLADAGMVTTHQIIFDVFADVFGDTLLWRARSEDDATYWYARLQPILERMFWVFERASEDVQAMIRGLPLLNDPGHADVEALPYILSLLGGRLPADQSEVLQREYVRQVIALHKIKGTTQAIVKGGRHRNLGTLKIRELTKTTFNEARGDYGEEFDDEHPLRAARVDLASCNTQCESFTEYALGSGEEYSGTNLTVREQIRYWEQELDDVRPVHVLIRRLMFLQQFNEEWAVSNDTVAILTTASLIDEFEPTEDELTITATCVGTCETSCQTCREELCIYTTFDDSWKFKVFDATFVPPSVIAFYLAHGGGSVTGVVDGTYYTPAYNDDDWGEDDLGTLVGWPPHSEIGLRKEVYIPYVTGMLVVVTIHYEQWYELYWNQVPISPLILSGDAIPYSDLDPLDPEWPVFEIPGSALVVGTNLVAVRAAEHLGGPNRIQVQIEVFCGPPENAERPKNTPIVITF